ncbi:DNA-deoxyinosine glycosylase [Eubacteriaceae bacterium ES2]|nr:DNA-deoxyinosine glycosylase [Eubacteriaceae bacterium ES2]
MTGISKEGKIACFAEHNFPPFFNENATILILGSFPSVKSREADFYYQHPQNRFWKVLSAVFEQTYPTTLSEQMQFLAYNRIALWDVIASCEIIGSSDSSIKKVIPNDIDSLLDGSSVSRIYTNGNKAFELYNRYCKHMINLPIHRLPSTSPANARWKLEDLIKQWQVILLI